MSVTETKELVKSNVPQKDLAQFEAACGEYGGLALQDMSEASKIVSIAQAIASVRNSLTPSIMSQIMQLQGTRLGFKTDKDRNRDGSKGTGYPVEVVKDVVVEAILYGARMTGNEVNIIAANAYLTKEYTIRKCRDLPGMTDLEITFGVPKIEGDKATVNCRAKWKMHGKEQTIGFESTDPCNISVRVYDGAGGGIDQALGKAEKKLRSRILARATGTTISLPEGDLDDRDAREVQVAVAPEPAPAPSPTVSAVHKRLANRTHEADPTPPPVEPEPTDISPAQAPIEREPGCDDEKAEESVATPPPSFERLSRHYDSMPQVVDRCLREAGIPKSLPQIDWKEAIKNPDVMAKLARASAKLAKEISK